ncbi:MAG: hypothetical protein IJA04_03185 [Bacteroidaceae bacterium]|nr:hypothetical protein [Bacteroidaceae bacterium]
MEITAAVGKGYFVENIGGLLCVAFRSCLNLYRKFFIEQNSGLVYFYIRSIAGYVTAKKKETGIFLNIKNGETNDMASIKNYFLEIYTVS